MMVRKTIWLSMALPIFAGALSASEAAGQLLGGGSGAPRIYYVRISGADTNDGLSPAKAFRTIQRAMNVCTTAGSTIYVGPGTYPEAVVLGNRERALLAAPQAIHVVGDGTGDFTLDAPGSVIVDGNNTSSSGIQLQSCDDWSFENLTFRNQTQYGIVVSSGSNITVRDCVFHVPPSYAVMLTEVGDCSVTNNHMIRGTTSGGGVYVHASRGTSTVIGSNRMSLTGPLYLSTSYRLGLQSGNPAVPSGPGGGGSYTQFGIYAMSNIVTANSVRVENNVVSDCYMGIYSSVSSALGTLSLVNNTTVGCTYGMYASAPLSLTSSCKNNLIHDCYINADIRIPLGTVSGLLTAGGRAPSSFTCTVVTPVAETTPVFKDAAGGDFTLASNSPGIDAGVTPGSPITDALGRERPVDGNRDGVDTVDIGAFESGARDRVRIVRFRGVNNGGEVEPAKDYEMAMLNRVNAALATTIDTTLSTVSETTSALTAQVKKVKTSRNSGSNNGNGNSGSGSSGSGSSNRSWWDWWFD